MLFSHISPKPILSLSLLLVLSKKHLHRESFQMTLLKMALTYCPNTLYLFFLFVFYRHLYLFIVNYLTYSYNVNKTRTGTLPILFTAMLPACRIMLKILILDTPVSGWLKPPDYLLEANRIFTPSVLT